MKLSIRIASLVGLATLIAPTAIVSAANVALTKPITVISGAGTILTPIPPLGVVTDGVFLAETTAYSSAAATSGAVRWNTTTPAGTVFEMDLGDLYRIDGIIVQADDNDSITIQYLDAAGAFQTLYNVPALSVGLGFRTRPNADQSTYLSVGPFDTTTVRFTNASGDGFFGVSEIQLRGTLVPEPSTLAAFALAGGLVRRRR